MRIWQAGKKREAAVIPPYTLDEAIIHCGHDMVKAGMLNESHRSKLVMDAWNIQEAYPKFRTMFRGSRPRQ